jgi:hypothetical protein
VSKQLYLECLSSNGIIDLSPLKLAFMKTRFTFLFFVFTICTGTALTVKAQVDVQDSLALVDLYNSTNGPEWYNNTNWLTDRVSTWYGITLTDDNKRVSVIWLDFNNLEGSLPPELGNLTNLQYLYLNNNQLSGSIPPELGNLTMLWFLYLYNNQLSGSLPPELGNLANLYGLYLYNNQLSGRIPPELGNLTKLANLILDANQLSGSIPPELGNPTILGYLSLNNNQLSGSIPPELGNLPNLTELYLSNNQLSGSIPAELGNLSYLSILHLDHNRLNGTIPSSIANLVDLRLLDLSYNRFSFDGIELVAQRFPFAKYNTQAILTPHINGNALSVSAGGTLSNNTYTWYKKGEAGKTKITGDSVFHPTETGVYAVRVQNSMANHLNLFSDTISYTAPIALNTFSVDSEQENVNNSFSVYPNPVKNILNIHAGGSASFLLLDQSEKILLTKDITTSGSMNVSNVATGVYYLKNSNTGNVKKVVIAR